MEIEDFRQEHSGERIFLLGNGPSLAETPLELLEDETTIAMNNVDRIYDKTSWRPTYYLNVQGFAIEDDTTPESVDTHVRVPMRSVSQEIPSFLSRDKQAAFPDRENIVYLDRIEVVIGRNEMLGKAERGDLTDIWQEDLSTGSVYRKHTSMYVAAQLAAYMGATELYFVGCDLYPEFKPWPHRLFRGGTDPRAFNLSSAAAAPNKKLAFLRAEGRPLRSLCNAMLYKSLRNDVLMAATHRILVALRLLRPSHFTGESTESHFEAGYYTEIYDGREFVQYGKNEKFIVVHKLIRTIGDHLGFETYNATLGGQLDVYPRVDLRSVLEA